MTTLALLLSLLPAFAQKALTAGSVPGMAIVIVQNDRVVYQGEFGVRDATRNLPVTRDTRFYIASSTKAFTAMAAAVAAAEGRINLDEPIADMRGASLRDLLAMRPGFANDTINYRSAMVGNIASDDEFLRLIRVYSRDVPRTFRYSNASYVMAAQAMEKATGAHWTDLITNKVLTPLGMSSTTMDLPPAGVPQAVFKPAKSHETMGPAGGMFTTTGDVARWLIAMLNDGRLDGRQALPERAVRLVQSEQTTNAARFRYIDRFAWGLGEDLGTYNGELIVHRFGGFGGAYSHISFMPDRHIGVAVFANGSGAAADAVALYAYDALLGKDLAKWTSELSNIAAAAEKERARVKDAAARLAEKHEPVRPLGEYTGTYRSDRLGTLTVRENNGKLEAQFGVLRGELVPAGGDSFLLDWTGEGELNSITISGTKFDWEGRIFEKERG